MVYSETGAFTTTNYTTVPITVGAGSGTVSFTSMAGTTAVVPRVSM